ncbi:MAG: hypothetical protein K5978_01955 [Campylobacter sp.]|nr:hypothetical protein [Campylobacter sp.]
MQNEILALFEKKKIYLKGLRQLDFSDILRSKTLEIYFGVDTKSYYTIVFVSKAKSKILRKNSDKFNELCANFEKKFDTAIKKRILFYSSQICQKAKKELENNGWKCYDFM